MNNNVIVAGITRSGLTMTMQMLNAGGFPCLGTYPAFEDFDLDIPYNTTNGKAIKAVDTHLNFPPEGNYKVIMLHRDLKQQARSQIKFCNIIGIKVIASKENIKRVIEGNKKDYLKISRWAKNQESVLNLHFEEILKDPEYSALTIQTFLDVELDIEKMADVVVKRSPLCYNGLLEFDMLNSSD